MSKRILVADDEAHILHVVSMKLKNAGYEVLTAVDGRRLSFDIAAYDEAEQIGTRVRAAGSPSSRAASSSEPGPAKKVLLTASAASLDAIAAEAPTSTPDAAISSTTHSFLLLFCSCETMRQSKPPTRPAHHPPPGISGNRIPSNRLRKREPTPKSGPPRKSVQSALADYGSCSEPFASPSTG